MLEFQCGIFVRRFIYGLPREVLARSILRARPLLYARVWFVRNYLRKNVLQGWKIPRFFTKSF